MSASWPGVGLTGSTTRGAARSGVACGVAPRGADACGDAVAAPVARKAANIAIRFIIPPPDSVCGMLDGSDEATAARRNQLRYDDRESARCEYPADGPRGIGID